MVNNAQVNGRDVRRLPGIGYDMRVAQAARTALTAAVSTLPQKKIRFQFKVGIPARLVADLTCNYAVLRQR